LKVELEDFTAS